MWKIIASKWRKLQIRMWKVIASKWRKLQIRMWKVIASKWRKLQIWMWKVITSKWRKLQIRMWKVIASKWRNVDWACRVFSTKYLFNFSHTDSPFRVEFCHVGRGGAVENESGTARFAVAKTGWAEPTGSKFFLIFWFFKFSKKNFAIISNEIWLIDFNF